MKTGQVLVSVNHFSSVESLGSGNRTAGNRPGNVRRDA